MANVASLAVGSLILIDISVVNQCQCVFFQSFVSN